MDSQQLAERIADIADDKKAADVVQLDLRGVLGYTDYFVICTGATARQVKAIQDAIVEALKDEGRLVPKRVEGTPDGGWVLLDYIDVVVHVFMPQMREFYRLEHLWSEAPERAAG